MPRNHLKTFPTALLRRGMVHFRPAAGATGRNLAARPPIPPALDAVAGPSDHPAGTVLPIPPAPDAGA